MSYVGWLEQFLRFILVIIYIQLAVPSSAKRVIGIEPY